MAEWISVYCRRQVSLEAEAMRRELDVADLWTLAEALELAEDELDAAVESMFRHLRVEPAGDGRAWIEVHWKPEGRPIQIGSVTDKRQIADMLEESLPAATGPGAASATGEPGPPTRVRTHLRQCQQIVNFELSIDDAQHLGATIGEVLAFFIAGAGEGLVWFFGQGWAFLDDRAATIWTTGEPASSQSAYN
ncbi:hypothetical protein AB0873_30090 [Micromonospora sp. NPDC047707]|uniref:hypothetical protein n=1 Tax=Micromonospora sp. NPDC047707 TaxID=3154498 RepID=UPI00345502B8